MFRKLAVLIALLLAPIVHAEFTAAEKTEIAKLGTHVNTYAAVYSPLADGIRDYGTDNARPHFFNTLVASVDGIWDCHEALRLLLNETADRPAAVSAGVARVQACDVKSGQFAAALDNVANVVEAESGVPAAGWARNIRSRANTIRNTNLDTFNPSLAYTSPDPPSFPRVVGPHGDSASAREHIAKMSEQFLRAVAFGTALYGQVDVWPQNANLDFREFIRYAVTPMKHGVRIWMMDVAIVLPGDQNAINQDVAAGSGLRGPDFFRLLREVELFNGTPHQPPLFSGRTMAGGIVPNFAIGFAEFPKVIRDITAVNSHAEVRTWWEGVKNYSATPPVLVRSTSNMIPGFFEVLAHAWEAGDEMTNSWIMFFHEIPPIP